RRRFRRADPRARSGRRAQKRSGSKAAQETNTGRAWRGAGEENAAQVRRPALARAQGSRAAKILRTRAARLMRIIGGEFRGRTLKSPASQAIRPTSDKLRESIFNILAHGYGNPAVDARVL